jgi:hypothetical protein
MKNRILLFTLFAAIACSPKSSDSNGEMNHEDHANHEAPAENATPSKSPRTSAMAMIDGNHVHIDYSSPSVRGRQIFGGLVAYGEVWVTGAHKATSIQFDKPVSINGKEIPAGKYGFFTIPGENEWTIILNENWDMHLADDYSQEKDILRFTVTPKELDQPVESLTYFVQETAPGMGEITVSWSTTQIKFDFKNS